MEHDTLTAETTESITRLRECVVHLDRAMSGVSIDLDLATYRAHQAGASPAEIARWIGADADSVRHTITALNRENDIDEWGEPGRWICLGRPC